MFFDRKKRTKKNVIIRFSFVIETGEKEKKTTYIYIYAFSCSLLRERKKGCILFFKMNFPSASPFDTSESDIFDDIVKSTKLSPDHVNGLRHYDNLVSVWSFYHEKSTQNQTIYDPVTAYCLGMEIHAPLPPGHHRMQSEFNPKCDDNVAQLMIGSSQRVSPQVESWNNISNMDFFLFDEQSTDIATDENPGIPFYPDMSGHASFPGTYHQPQLNNSYQSTVVDASSQMDIDHQQSSSYNCYGLRYHPVAPSEPIPPPSCCFGSAELAPHMPIIQVQSTFDLDPPSFKKPLKKSLSRSSSSSSVDPQPINMNDWYVKDKNGKKRRPLLHEFLRILLDNENYSHIAKYVDKKNGIFKFYHREKAAELWQLVKGRNTDSGKFYYCLKIP